MNDTEMKFSKSYSTDMYHVGLLRKICDATGLSKSEIINRMIEVKAQEIAEAQTETQPTN